MLTSSPWARCRSSAILPSSSAIGFSKSRKVAMKVRYEVSGCCGDLLGLRDQDFRLADRREVDEAAVQRDGALALFLRLDHRLQDPMRLLHLRIGRREELVRDRHLRGMDRP